jgi:hypothetical protein
LDEAGAAYREALAATPGYAAALNGLGSVLFRKGQVGDAITRFREATQADPGLKMAFFNLGYAARKTGDAATAAQAYERYTQLEPSDADGYYGLGESYRQLGQKDKAIPAYQAYIAREKRPGEQVWVRKAREYLTAMGAEPLPANATVPAAAAASTQSAAATPAVDLPAPFPESRPASAAPVAEPERTPNPALAAARIRDGDALMKERRYREAAFAFLDATHADAGHVEALFKLGNAMAVLGYYGQAVEKWERAGGGFTPGGRPAPGLRARRGHDTGAGPPRVRAGRAAHRHPRLQRRADQPHAGHPAGADAGGRLHRARQREHRTAALCGSRGGLPVRAGPGARRGLTAVRTGRVLPGAGAQRGGAGPL